jgi:hypothetical protein
MQQFLPKSDFRFLTDEDISMLDIDSVSDESTTGYILEVDLEYPTHLHDLHNDYPLAPERLLIKPEMLSPYNRDLSEGAVMSEKLVSNLMSKTKYVLHYRNLKLYKRLGLIVTKIHRVLTFTQDPWMRPYIELNTSMRQMAKSEFEKSLFKLMNNAVFGKTLQNCRNYIDLRLVANPVRARKLVAKPTFKYFNQINDDLVCIEMMKPKITLDKPIYCGFTILDLSKELMCKFHYDVIKARYKNSANLCMTDTDSLLYEITTENVYEDMFQDLSRYDTSNYTKDSKLFSKENACVVGKMKDETAGKPVLEVAGVKSKMYGFRTDKPKMVAKGIKKSYIKKHLTLDMYKQTVRNKTVTHAEFFNFRSKSHSLHTVKINKVCLSAYDDKRYILDDGITTLAYGHYSIEH